MTITYENGAYIARYRGREITGASIMDAITKMIELLGVKLV